MQRLRHLTLALLSAMILVIAAGCEAADEPDDADDPDTGEDEPVEEDTDPPEEDDEVEAEDGDAAERVETAAENTEQAETAQLMLQLDEGDGPEGTDDADAGDETGAGQDAAAVEMEGAVDFGQDHALLETVDNGLAILIDGEQAYLRVQTGAGEAGPDDDAAEDDETDALGDDYTWVEVALDDLRDVDVLGGPGGVAFQSPQDAITELQDVVEAREVETDDEGVNDDEDNGLLDDDENGLEDDEDGVTEDDENGLEDDEDGVTDDDENGLDDDDENGLDDDTADPGIDTAGLTQYQVVIERDDTTDNGLQDDDENGLEDDENGLEDDDEAPAEDDGAREITADVWIDDDEELIHAVRYHLDEQADDADGVTDDDEDVLDEDENGVTDDDEDVLDDDENGVTDDDGMTEDDEATTGAQPRYLTIEFQGHGDEVEIEGPAPDEVEEIDTEQLRQFLRQPGQEQDDGAAEDPTDTEDDNDDEL